MRWDRTLRQRCKVPSKQASEGDSLLSVADKILPA